MIEDDRDGKNFFVFEKVFFFIFFCIKFVGKVSFEIRKKNSEIMLRIRFK